MALADLTPYARTILACADAATARTTLGLGALAVLDDVTENEISLSDVTTDNVSTAKHGFAPKAPNDGTVYLDGLGGYSVPGTLTPGAFPTLSVATAIRLSAELSALTLETDNRVTQINDLSGNARHFTAASGSQARPRWFRGAPYFRRPAIVFDGLNSVMAYATGLTLAQPFSVLAVFHFWAQGGGNSHIWRDANGVGPVTFISGGNTWAMFAGSTLSSAALYQQNTDGMLMKSGVANDSDFAQSASAILISVFNGASSIIANNGVEVTGNAGATGTTGAISLTFPVGNRARLALYEFGMFSGAFSAGDRAALNAYYAPLLDIRL
jgi:hypothetical protein